MYLLMSRLARCRGSQGTSADVGSLRGLVMAFNATALPMMGTLGISVFGTRPLREVDKDGIVGNACLLDAYVLCVS